MITAPHGIVEIRRVYGDIQVAVGKVVAPPGWESANMIVVPDLPGWPKKRYIHKLIEEPLRAALAACIALGDGYEIKTLGCFAPRAKRSNPNVLSLHSWGVAVDLNAATNPMRKPLTKDIPDAWIAAFEASGWTWGGNFPTPDPMHFQYATNY